MFVMPINAQTPAEFGYQLHPEKLLENTVGTLQIFVTSNEMMVPRSINDLKVISSDNSVIQIIDIQEIKRYVIDYFKREGVKDFICSSFSKNEVNGILPGKKHLIFEITNYNFGSRKMQEMIKNIGFQYRYTDMYGQKIEMKTFHVLNNKK